MAVSGFWSCVSRRGSVRQQGMEKYHVSGSVSTRALSARAPAGRRSSKALSPAGSGFCASMRSAAVVSGSSGSRRMPNWSSRKSYTPLNAEMPSARAAPRNSVESAFAASGCTLRNVDPSCGAAMATSACTQSALPPVNSGEGASPAASAACTSSGQPCASSCASSRAVAPPKLWPTRSMGRSAPQSGTSGFGYAVPKRAWPKRCACAMP